MSKRIMQVSAGVATLAMLAMPVMAQQIQPTLPPSPVTSVGGLVDILRFVVRVIFTVLMVVAIAFILWAAYKYLTAMGDQAKVMEAHKALLSAAIAIAVALIATGVEAIVRSILERQG